MFRPRVTTEYPDEKRPKPERFHGRHVLNRYEDGMEKCIGCELCAGVCPARCIYVRGADNPPDAPVSPGERYGFVYEINYLRCIHCDLCVEACPTEAITETKLFEFSFRNREDTERELEELRLGDRLGGTRLHAEVAVDAPQVVDLVDEPVPLAGRDRYVRRVVGAAHVDAACRAHPAHSSHPMHFSMPSS